VSDSIILGVDPGYRNLGLAVVRLSEGGIRAEVLWSDSFSVGSAEHGMAFHKVLVPKLEELALRYNFAGVAMETPPFIQRQIKTSALLWAVGAIIWTWGHLRGLTLRHCSPIAIKRAVCRALGLPWNRKFIPKKAQVKETICHCTLTGQGLRTSHENDAALAAILLYGSIIPETVA